MEFLNQLVLQIKTIFAKMSNSQKISFLLLIGSIIICLSVVFMWSSKPDYAVLFSDLSTDDAAKIHAKLNEMKIPFTVVGTTIKVPSQQVYDTRLVLANEGLPKGSTIGYEIFDKTNLGQTDYLQRLNYQRALEGELSRTISSLTNVEFARVHLVMPKPTIFSEKEEKVSASIVLTTSMGRGLGKDNIVAITHLVASSVEGLEPGNITIIDSRGNLLSSVIDNNLAVSLTGSQLEVQKNVENYLEDKVSSLLVGVLGPGKSIVRVTAEINFAQSEETAEVFNPESQVARSENRIEESSTAEQGAGSTVEKTITNFEINKTIKHIIGETGNIEKLSIAVVVDGVYRNVEGESAEAQKTYVARTEEEKDSIRKLVTSAIAIDEKRGDMIEVINIPFDNSYMNEQQMQIEEMRRTELMNNLLKQWPWIVVVVMFLVLLGFLQRIISQGVSGKGAVPSMKRKYSQMSGMYGVEEEPVDDGLTPDQRTQKKLQDEVMQLAAGNPDAVAKVVRTWLSEE